MQGQHSEQSPWVSVLQDTRHRIKAHPQTPVLKTLPGGRGFLGLRPVAIHMLHSRAGKDPAGRLMLCCHRLEIFNTFMVLGLPNEVAALCKVSLLELFCSLPGPLQLPVTWRCLQSPRLQGLGNTQLLEPSLQFSFIETHVLNVLRCRQLYSL